MIGKKREKIGYEQEEKHGRQQGGGFPAFLAYS
jgi:hypothetical protein